VQALWPSPQIFSDARVLAAYAIFFASYFVFALGKFPGLKIDRPGALLLITRSTEPRGVYDEVDWGLLVFFMGLFIIVGGAEHAGLTHRLLQPFLPWNLWCAHDEE